MPFSPSQGVLGSHLLPPTCPPGSGRKEEKGSNCRAMGAAAPEIGVSQLGTCGLCCPREKSITFTTFFHFKPVNL